MTDPWADMIIDDIIRPMSAGTEFTTDIIHKYAGPPPSGADSRALGSVMIKARRLKLIVATGEYKKSTRSECNRRPVAVWRRIRDRR